VTYQCALDLLTGKPLNEECDEFFYAGIVSASLKSTTYTYEKSKLSPKLLATIDLAEPAVNEIHIAADIFSLTTAGGNSIEMMLDAPKMIKKLGGGKVNVDPSKDAVNAIKAMLRTKMKGDLPERDSMKL
jgi:hypothetical protein